MPGEQGDIVINRQEPSPPQSGVEQLRQAGNAAGFPYFRECLAHTPANLLQGFNAKNLDLVTHVTERAQTEFADDSSLEALCNSIFIEGKLDWVKDKTTRQIKTLTRMYERGTPFFNISEKRRKKQKLADFEQFVASLKPVRADNRQGIAEFKSPRQTGNIQFYGGLDILVQADAYVYGSFDKIHHYMAGGATYELDEQDIADRATIVTQDIEVMMTRDHQRVLRKYITNLFDYTQGKKILALYLASVFDSPDEAVAFIARNNDSHAGQLWPHGYGVNYFDVPGTEESVSEKRLQEIISAMKVIMQETDIEPPLTLEVRVRDSAKVKAV